MSFIDLKISELEAERAQLKGQLDEIEFVISALKGSKTKSNGAHSTKTSKPTTTTRTRRKSPKRYQTRVRAIVSDSDQGLISRKDLVKRLGGGHTSAYRAVKNLLDKKELRVVTVDEKEMIALPAVATTK